MIKFTAMSELRGRVKPKGSSFLWGQNVAAFPRKGSRLFPGLFCIKGVQGTAEQTLCDDRRKDLSGMYLSKLLPAALCPCAIPSLQKPAGSAPSKRTFSGLHTKKSNSVPPDHLHGSIVENYEFPTLKHLEFTQ